MSKSRILQCHKVLRARLRDLNLQSYDDGRRMLGVTAAEITLVLGRKYKLTYYACDYLPGRDIVVAAFLNRSNFLCGEGYSAGYLITEKNKVIYMSQKKLWDFGF